MSRGLFEGLKVIDAATYVAAPGAATILGDFGADVIKLEPPEGDAYRSPKTVALWQLGSRNKRSLALDLKTPVGLGVLHRLLDQTDVFITNLPIDARKRLKIDYQQLSAGRPRLIYASFTAYGEVGPDAGKSGFDSTTYWSRSGLMEQTRVSDDADPSWPVSGIGDQPSAVTLYAAIVSALYRREHTGLGGEVSSSLLANGLWSNALPIQRALRDEPRPPRMTRATRPSAAVNNYRCADGRWLSLMLLNEGRRFHALLEALGLEQLAGDIRFSTADARAENAGALITHFDAAFAARDLDHWREKLVSAGIPFDIVASLDDVKDDRQAQAIGSLISFGDNPEFRTVNSPFNIRGTEKIAPRRAPELGEHNEELLREAGFPSEEIEQLRKSGVLAARVSS